MVVRKGEGLEQSILMILKVLLNIWMIWTKKTLKNTIQKKKSKILIVFNDMIADMFKSIKRIQ